jgi:hypothetical protein
MPEAQNFRNHARFEPRVHAFILPVLLINFISTIVVLIHRWPRHLLLHAWLVVLAFALLLLATVTRTYALTVQDRVIRLEEQLRYQRLLTPDQLAAAQALTLRQIIALRFASDAELPALVQRTLTENLAPKTIKQSIVHWRPDTLRV